MSQGRLGGIPVFPGDPRALGMAARRDAVGAPGTGARG